MRRSFQMPLNLARFSAPKIESKISLTWIFTIFLLSTYSLSETPPESDCSASIGTKSGYETANLASCSGNPQRMLPQNVSGAFSCAI